MDASRDGPPDTWVPTRPVLRWGLPDVALAWAVGLVGSVVAGVVAVAATGVSGEDAADHLGVLLASIVGQGVGTVAALAAVSRAKGRGSLGLDFGLAVPGPRAWVRGALYVVSGVGLQIGLTLILLPLIVLAGDDEGQAVVEAFDDADGLEALLFVVAVVAVAPLVEELLFRGALLRALLRRTTAALAIFWSALAFAVIHPLLALSVGDVAVVPALLAFGLVAGTVAVRTGRLYGPVLLHAGFNLITAVAVLAA